MLTFPFADPVDKYFPQLLKLAAVAKLSLVVIEGQL
jgi:hypothetical protein